MQKLVTILLFIATLVVYDVNGCPSTCRCQNDPIHDLLFVACEGITTSETLKDIAKNIPLNTTGLGLAHYDYWLFLTHAFPVLQKLRLLSIKSGTMREIPRYMGKYFPNLQNLFIARNGISRISPELFLRMKNLTTINLSNNFISVIERSAFVHAPNLRVLKLDSNRLQRIHPKAFHGLKKLTSLTLQGNDIKYLIPGTFSFAQSPDYVGATDINLEGNRLSKISNGVFSNIRAIKTLNLNKNFISSIEDKAFHNVKYIFQLQLSHNFIKIFPVQSIAWSTSPPVPPQSTKIVYLSLYENPTHCDCELLDLIKKAGLIPSNLQAVCKSPTQFYNSPFTFRNQPLLNYLFRMCAGGFRG